MRKHEFVENLAKVATRAAQVIAKPGIAAGQVINLAGNKSNIVTAIDRSLKSGSPLDIKQHVYNALRGASDVKAVDQLGFSQAEKLQFKAYTDSWNINNGAWAQKNFGTELPAHLRQRTYNYYNTLVKDRDNINKFIQALPDLDRRMAELSKKTRQPINYKINNTLTSMATDNDNFKVFYYEPKLKLEVEALVQRWLQDNRITMGPRTHVHGVDIKGQGSYGQIVADSINKTMDDLIKKHGNQYTPEQYYQWLGQNINTLIGRIIPST